MNSKLFILVLALSLSATWAQLAIPGKLIGGGGLIANRGLIGGAPIGAVYGSGLGYGLAGGLGLAGVNRVAVGGLGLGAIGGLGLGAVRGVGLAGGLGYGLAGGLGLARAGVGYAQYTGPVPAAIETIRTHQVIDVPTSQDVITPSTLIIEPNVLPVNIEFRSQSSPVNVNQVHIPGRPGIVERTSSEEEPDRLIHEVVKPVVQEVRETIVPFRRITQEILPVQEEVQSLVARGQRQQVLAQPAIAARVAAPVAVAAPVGGLITTGINRIGGLGLVNGGVINGGLVGGGLVNGGLVGGGLVNGGLVGGGLVNAGLVDGGLVGGGIVRGGVISKGLELIKAGRRA